MEHYDRSNQTPSYDRASINGIQMIIVTQLLQVIATMHHIDELLSWLAQIVVQRFGLQLLQFWATQASRNGEASLELRTSVYTQVLSSPEGIINNQIVEAAKYVLTRQRSVLFTPVERAFPQQQATLMQRYGLSYCSGYYLRGNVLLPPAEPPRAEKVPTPLALAAMLFIEQEPSPQLLPVIGQLLERVVPIAQNRGLLLPLEAAPASSQVSSPPALAELVPRYTGGEMLRSSNPFSSAVIIDDKLARRLYRQIDGRKKIGELARTSGLSSQELVAALRTLVNLQVVELSTARGELIEQALTLDLLKHSSL